MIISKPQTDQSSAGNKHGYLTSQSAWGLGLPITVTAGRAVPAFYVLPSVEAALPREVNLDTMVTF